MHRLICLGGGIVLSFRIIKINLELIVQNNEEDLFTREIYIYFLIRNYVRGFYSGGNNETKIESI